MRVEQMMTKQVQTCRPEDSLERAAQLMWDYDCGSLPVCSGDGPPKTSCATRGYAGFRWSTRTGVWLA